jgi:hypothetical protein
VVAAFFWGKTLQWHLRDLESNVGVRAEAQERAIWERSHNKVELISGPDTSEPAKKPDASVKPD